MQIIGKYMSQQISNWRFVPRRHIVGERALALVIPIYILSIVIAEAIGVFVMPLAGVLCQALLIPALLAHYAAAEGAPYRRILPALALVPLLRILSLTMPIKFVPAIYWYALIGIPLLVAIVQTARVLELTLSQLGLRPRAMPLQLGITLLGVPLGLLAFLLLPAGQMPATSLGHIPIAIGVVTLVIFTGFAEELLFRGLLQHVLGESLGSASVLISSLLFATVYLGALSVAYIVFVALVGLLFGWSVRRTGSIWGVVGAHSLISVGVAYIWPHVGLAPGQQFSGLSDSALWLLVALGIGAVVLAIVRRWWPKLRSRASR